MRRRNVESGYEFEVDASIGSIYCEVMDAEELGGRIEEADQRMYEEKRTKKSARRQTCVGQTERMIGHGQD